MIKYTGTVTALSPISHGADEKLGTDTKLRRIKMLYNNEAIEVPIVSGNSYRGILRRIAADDFLSAVGYKKEMLSDKVYYMLFSGGALEKGSSSEYIDIGAKRDLRSMIPFISVFGTACGNQINEGKLKCMMCIPICQETSVYTDLDSNLSMWDLIDEIFYTRRDDRKAEDRAGDKEGAQQMKYNIEVFAQGAKFFHEFILDTDNEVELNCFGAIMKKFTEEPFLGGNSAIGHGKVKIEYEPSFTSGEVYYRYLEENKEKIGEFIKKIL